MTTHVNKLVHAVITVLMIGLGIGPGPLLVPIHFYCSRLKFSSDRGNLLLVHQPIHYSKGFGCPLPGTRAAGVASGRPAQTAQSVHPDFTGCDGPDALWRSEQSGYGLSLAGIRSAPHRTARAHAGRLGCGHSFKSGIHFQLSGNVVYHGFRIAFLPAPVGSRTGPDRKSSHHRLYVVVRENKIPNRYVKTGVNINDFYQHSCK